MSKKVLPFGLSLAASLGILYYLHVASKTSIVHAVAYLIRTVLEMLDLNTL